MIPPLKSLKTDETFINLWKMGSIATAKSTTANAGISASTL
jgi:hypothetical protein